MDMFQLWQCIYQEAVQLAETVERLPDECECGDADAHLGGRCCSREGQKGGRENGETNCNEILARLRADLMMLSKDFLSVAPPMEEMAFVENKLEMRRGIFLAADDLQQTLQAFDRVTGAVAGFHRNCAATEMRGVKRRCAEFRQHCERINTELSAQQNISQRAE